MRLLCGIVLTMLALTNNVLGHVYLPGSRCPNAPPMDDFHMQKFLGVWYAIEKSRSFAECLTYNISQPDPERRPDDFLLEQTSWMMRSQIRYTGRIRAPSRSTSRRSGHMSVQFPLNMIGRSSFQVFSTDYKSFAGIYTCQPLMFLHRHSVTLLSRTKELDEHTLRNLRYQMYDNHIQSLDLRSIEQHDCDLEANRKSVVNAAGWAKYYHMQSLDRDVDSNFQAEDVSNNAAEDEDAYDSNESMSPTFAPKID